jgi:hypothetical protein
VHFFIPFVALFPVQGLLIKNFAGPAPGIAKGFTSEPTMAVFFSQLKVKGTWAFAAASKLWSAKKPCGEFKSDFLFLINLTTPITSSGFEKTTLKNGFIW